MYFYRHQPPLPSFSRGKSKGLSCMARPSKRKKADIETYERDIICLPLNHPNDSGLYSYPRGKIRTQLAQSGLIGKISLKSWMNEVEIKAEIRSCFAKPFGDDPFFPFKFLQSAGIGAKSLIVPATSDSYEWKPKQVATMGGTRGMYILAEKPIVTKAVKINEVR